MKNLKYLIAAGLLTISFNVPAVGTYYGSTDPVVINNHPNLDEIFNEDIGDNLINLSDGLYAYKFNKDEIPDYFSIGGDLHGIHTDNGDTFILFENIDKLSYGVFALSSLDDYGNMVSTMSASMGGDDNDNNGFQIEHIVGYNATRINSVPIPAAVWLSGSGLIGLVAVARRKN